MDRGALALQINEGKPKLVHLPEPTAADSVSSKHLEATVGTDGSAQIDWRVDITGASAGSWRQRYHAKATQKQRVQEDLSDRAAGRRDRDGHVERPRGRRAEGPGPRQGARAELRAPRRRIVDGAGRREGAHGPLVGAALVAKTRHAHLRALDAGERDGREAAARSEGPRACRIPPRASRRTASTRSTWTSGSRASCA